MDTPYPGLEMRETRGTRRSATRSARSPVRFLHVEILF